MADRRSMYIAIGTTRLDLEVKMKFNPVWHPERLGPAESLEISEEEWKEHLVAEVIEQAQQVVPDLIRAFLKKVQKHAEEQAKQPINQESSG